MTDITDNEKRVLREWAEENQLRDEETHLAARYILANVDAPTPTLAEELRALGALLEEEGGAGAKSTCWAKDLAARAEQIEKELDKAIRRTDQSDADLAEVLDSRDEARAEVERLTSERDGAREEIAWLRNGPGHTEVATDIPDPADVKPGEAWLVEVNGERRNAVKDKEDTVPWNTVTAGGFLYSARNTDINLLHRLVPAPRVITDPDELDKLPIKAVVLAGQESFQRGAPTIGFDGEDPDDWYGHGDTAGFTSAEVLAHGPVTVLWEAGE